jgi:hypothetical protein
MKKIHLTFLLAILVFTFSCNVKTQTENKSVLFSTWKLVDNEMKKVEELPHLNYKEVYDSENNLIEVINYMNETVFATSKYTYENGLKKLMEQYDKENQLTQTTSFDYNEANQLVQENIDNIKSNLKFLLKYYYDAEGSLTKKEFFDSENNLVEYWNYSYQTENNNKTETEEYFRKNELAMVTKTVFNEIGLEIEKTKIYPDKAEETKMTYQYEMKPGESIDWIVKKSFLNDSLVIENRKLYQ